jgi:DNA-binding NtrC family response regulator
VRELEHAIEKAVILVERDRIDAEALTDLAAGPEPAGPATGVAAGGSAGAAALAGALPDFTGLSLEDLDARWMDLERAYLQHIVRDAEGNLSKAARLARVKNRNTLISRLKRHGIGRKGG